MGRIQTGSRQAPGESTTTIQEDIVNEQTLLDRQRSRKLPAPYMAHVRISARLDSYLTTRDR